MAIKEIKNEECVDQSEGRRAYGLLEVDGLC